MDRERACIERFNEFPRQQGIYNAPGLYHPSSAAKLSVLSKVLPVIPALLASKKLDLTSIMWHPDLHRNNIFVDPDEPTRITGIIDWQAVHLSPLFVQGRYPSFIEVDDLDPVDLAVPKLPENFAELSSEGQLAAKAVKLRQILRKLYEIDLARQAPAVYKTLQTRPMLPNQILGLIGSIFGDGEPILEGLLIALSDEWATTLADSDQDFKTCPISFSAEDRLRQADEQSQWERSVVLRAEVIEELGTYRGWDGFVNPEDYAEMKTKLEVVRERFLDRHAATDDERALWAKAWPFGAAQHV